MENNYPEQLVQALRASWPSDAVELPDEASLVQLLSTCYQASMLQEEGRSISFRLLHGDCAELPAGAGPPNGVQILEFATPRPFVASELRRLSPAAEFYRAMLGACCDGEAVRLWGLVHTGPGWSREMLGGRMRELHLPRWLVLHAKAPGELSVYCGTRPIVTLRGGRIEQRDLDVFLSSWLPHHFERVRAEVMGIHRSAREASGEAWTDLDPDFLRMLPQHVLRRTIGVMRQRRHGGTILFLPPDCTAMVDAQLHIKYAFKDAGPRRRFRTVLVEAMNRLARSAAGRPGPVGWRAYSESTDGELAELDEALFEVGHLCADLSSVDGALVLTQRFELLGFGAEISGNLEPVSTVWRAMDHDGTDFEPVPAETFGTRHRSVFRLCNAHPDLVAIVVSQDGQVRFVKKMDDRVAYFDHRVVGAL